jgi:hypothetical protein
MLGMLLITLAGGCAPAYHSYDGCSVNCRYCPPRPLPYACYDPCVCHSCAVQPYLVRAAGTDVVGIEEDTP